MNKKINKEKPFAILEFACKMLKRCPLQYSVVLKSCMSRHLKYMANSPQSAVSECSVISVAASSCNNKEVEVTRLRWYYTSAVQVWFLNCRSTTKRIFHHSDLFRMKARTHSCMNKLPRESWKDAELLQTTKEMLTLSHGQSEEFGFPEKSDIPFYEPIWMRKHWFITDCHRQAQEHGHIHRVVIYKGSYGHARSRYQDHNDLRINKEQVSTKEEKEKKWRKSCTQGNRSKLAWEKA